LDPLQTTDHPPTKPPVPWDAPDLFPPRPSGHEHTFGYLDHGRVTPCTREELADACVRLGPGLVWTPDSPRTVTPMEVPFLLDALRRRANAGFRLDLAFAAFQIIAGTALALLNPGGGRFRAMYLLTVMIFGVVPACQAAWGLYRLRTRPAEYLAEQAAAARYGEWLGMRRIRATWMLAGCLIVVGLCQLAVDRNLTGWTYSTYGAGLVKDAARNGEYWRLATCTLLHGHPLHFLFNFITLLAVGRLLEVHGHPAYLPTVFLVSALSGSAASLYLAPGQPVSVGASGGLMGLIGFLAVLGFRRRHVLPRGFLRSIALGIALTAAIGLVAWKFVDNAAHGGGLVAGVLLGLVYVSRRQAGNDPYRLTPSRPATVAGAVCTVTLICVTVFTTWVLLSTRRA
jgi:membrane associated rhomboid family serine protease